MYRQLDRQMFSAVQLRIDPLLSGGLASELVAAASSLLPHSEGRPMHGVGFSGRQVLRVILDSWVFVTIDRAWS